MVLSGVVKNTRPPGGARRDRTDDLMLAKHALSQLSYGPILVGYSEEEHPIMVGLGRLERPTSPLSGVRSNHLSYRPLAPQISSQGNPQAHPGEERETRTAASRMSVPDWDLLFQVFAEASEDT